MGSKTDEVSQFFGVEGDQDAGFELLPTGDKEDAPPGNLYTFEIDSEETEVKHSSDDKKVNPGVAYVNFRALVLEPDIHEGRSQFGMLYAPIKPDDPDDAKLARNFRNAQKRFVGAVDAVLGKGTAAALPHEREAMMERLCEQLKGEVFVGELRYKPASNGFRAKTEIAKFFPADYELPVQD